MLRPGGVGGDERQVDLGLLGGGQLDLRLLGRFLQPLQRQLVAAQVDALVALELVGEVIDHTNVEILTAEERVAVGGLHLEHAVADLQHRHVERAAAKVIDRDHAGMLLVHAIGQRSSGRLVDDAQHFQAGDAAGILGGLALGVVEVGGNRDHGLRNRLAEIGFGGFLHLAENEGADLARRVFLAAGFHPRIAVVALDDGVRHQTLVLRHDRIVIAAPDQTLDGIQGVGRVGDALALGGLADQTLATVGESNHRGGRARALAVLDNPNVLAFHDGNAGVRGAEIDTNNFTHSVFLSAEAGSPKHRTRPYGLTSEDV